MHIRILFYKAKLGDGYIIDNLISWWTGIWNWGTKGYSHCEIWVPDGGRFDAMRFPTYEDDKKGNGSIFHYIGTCYTSTMRGDNNGVVKRPASEVLKNPGRWDYYEIEVDESFYNDMIDWMEVAVLDNEGYDKRAILKFFNPFARSSSLDKYICSEFVQHCLVDANVFMWPELLSPRRLSSRLDKMGHKSQELING